VGAVNSIPHLRIVVAFSFLAIAGYAVFSVWVMIAGDPATKGDVVGTWKSFGVLAFGFWLGSSSAGKAKADAPSGSPGDPVAVKEEK
jgi:hypothetical protein